ELIAASGLQAIYVPSAPCGGDLPFRTDRGIANYYGVGGYRRALAEVKSAGVRFAAECLAFANVPEAQMIEDIFKDAPASVAVHHPRWKAGVPRDVGTGWDFDDVRDHYLRELYGVDDAELRRSDHERYLELSRLVSGEVMAEVFGEWRRTGSSCGGGLVLWLRDLYPGAGWGVIDQSGTPKVAYHYLARALAPVAVWMTDEGLNGVRVHIANDRPETLRCDLRLAVYSEHEHRVQEMNHQIALAGHESAEYDLEALLGRFLDATWAYRFGPPAHDVLVATLQRPGIGEEIQLLSQAFRFPLGRPHDQQTAEELGLEGTLLTCADGALSLMLRSRRLAYGVRVNVPGFHPADDALTLEPGVARTLALSPLDDNGGPPGQARLEAPPDATLTALNLRGRVRLIDPSST
ncbi:MAG TPA: hypothetical protein VID48_13195, partial [Solirubrobacteraceae bacterium]